MPRPANIAPNEDGSRFILNITSAEGWQRRDATGAPTEAQARAGRQRRPGMVLARKR